MLIAPEHGTEILWRHNRGSSPHWHGGHVVAAAAKMQLLCGSKCAGCLTPAKPRVPDTNDVGFQKSPKVSGRAGRRPGRSPALSSRRNRRHSLTPDQSFVAEVWEVFDRIT